nr:reverse transcriptase domain-containing protein [Tanacetum cinerariifolium]
MKKIETELWNLEVQGTDLTRYNQRFDELALLCEATEMATGLMDKKIRTYAERQAANKRKFEDTSRNNQGRQQPPKRQDMARAYAAGSDNRQQYAGSRPLSPTNANVANNQRGNGAGQKSTCYECGAQGHFKRNCPKLKNNNNNNRGNQVGTGNAQERVYAVGNAGTNPDANTVTGSGNRQQYTGSRPLYPKCNFNHDGPCTPRCYNYNKIGHLSRNCRSPTNSNVAKNQRGNEAGQKVTYYECGAQGHFKRYCPKLKNNKNNRGNQVGTGNAQARVYAVGNAGTNPDANTVMGMFLLNNCYASVLFDTGAVRSFVSTAFSSQFDIAPTVLDHDYAVELPDGRIVGVNTVIRSCTLNFLNHPFNIDLMPIKMGSFDVIIGIAWLSRYQAVIVCADKIVRIPWGWGRETLIFYGDGSNQEHEARIDIISCEKTQKYMLKGCQVFLAHVTTKEAEGKSEKKRLENVPIVHNFPKKGVVRFGKRGKLNTRYVGPFKVLERVRDVAYKLDLPEELSRVHNTFYVSNLKKCHADEPLAVPLDGLHFDDKLYFVKEPMEIVDREVKRLKQS